MIKKSLQGQIQTKVCTNMIKLITTPPPRLADIDCMAQIWELKVIQPFLLVLYETTWSICMTSQTYFFSYKPQNSHLPGRKININWTPKWLIEALIEEFVIVSKFLIIWALSFLAGMWCETLFLINLFLIRKWVYSSDFDNNTIIFKDKFYFITGSP